MHAKYEVSTSNGSKIIAKVKVNNRQTDKQTGQKQYAPIIRSVGLKRADLKTVSDIKFRVCKFVALFTIVKRL